MVTRESNRHGRCRVFNYRQELNVTEVEAALFTEPIEHHMVLFYEVTIVVRSNLQFQKGNKLGVDV